jgi:hypothetical protein
MSTAAQTFEAPDDLDEINRLYRERKWGDGLPIVPPTFERVERMLQHTKRDGTRSSPGSLPASGRRRSSASR